VKKYLDHQPGKKRESTPPLKLIPFWKRAIGDDTGLTEEVSKRTAPVEPNSELKKMDRDARRRRRVQEGREKQRLATWTKWRDELLANPATAFSWDNLATTVSNIYKWLDARRAGARSSFNMWNADALTQAFGTDITNRATAAFSSGRAANIVELSPSRGTQQHGLAAEATSPGWATDRGRPTRRLAMSNGFSSWLGDLAVATPMRWTQ
jgi:hypothetical protein